MATKRKRNASSISPKKSKMIRTSPSAPIIKDPATTSIVQHSALLALPSEILTHILTFLLVRDDGEPILLRSANERRWRNEICKLVDIECPSNQWRGPVNYNELDSAVKAIASSCKSELLKTLVVCRDFYFAGVAAFFGGNTFRFESTGNLLRMAKNLDIDRRRHISKIMIGRDVNGDHKELLAPGAPSVEHDPTTLFAAFERLPALKLIVFDFTMGGSAAPMVWQRLRIHINALRCIYVTISDNISFAVDGKITDSASWAVAK